MGARRLRARELGGCGGGEGGTKVPPDAAPDANADQLSGRWFVGTQCRSFTSLLQAMLVSIKCTWGLLGTLHRLRVEVAPVVSAQRPHRGGQ